jgi:hypothetical protein
MRRALDGCVPRGAQTEVDADGINLELVLEDGSVNANLRHDHQAGDALAAADVHWLDRLMTRRAPLKDFADALEARDDDVKVIISLDETA